MIVKNLLKSNNPADEAVSVTDCSPKSIKKEGIAVLVDSVNRFSMRRNGKINDKATDPINMNRFNEKKVSLRRKNQ
jgi:hypothetical protein